MGLPPRKRLALITAGLVAGYLLGQLGNAFSLTRWEIFATVAAAFLAVALRHRFAGDR